MFRVFYVTLNNSLYELNTNLMNSFAQLILREFYTNIRDLVETAEFAWTARVRGSRRLRCGCGGSLTCGSLGG